MPAVALPQYIKSIPGEKGVYSPAGRTSENPARTHPAAALTSQLNGYEVTIHPRNAPHARCYDAHDGL